MAEAVVLEPTVGSILSYSQGACGSRQGGSSGDDGQSLLPAGGKAGIFEFCTISFHFGASAAGEGGLEDSGLERREERPEFSNSVPFCTISFHFGASAAGEGGLEDSGLERRLVTTRHGPQWLVLIGSGDMAGT